MSLWVRKESELEEYARKCAMWGAFLFYIFIVVFLFICFMPQKRTVSLMMPRHGVPAPIMFHSRGKRGVCGGGRATRLLEAHQLLKHREHKGGSSLGLPKKQQEISKQKSKSQKIVQKKRVLQKIEKEEPSVLVKKMAERQQDTLIKKSEKKNVPVVPVLKKTHQIAVQDKVKEVTQKQSPVKKELSKKISKEIEERTLIPSSKKEKEKERAKETFVKSTPKKEILAIQEEDVFSEDLSNEDDNGEGEAVFGVTEGEYSFDEEGVSREGIAVMRSIGRVWRPPRGLSPLLSARLSVSLKNDGAVETVVIEKKSGVLAFDLAARAALWRAEYPEAFWGKSIVVVFGKQTP